MIENAAVFVGRTRRFKGVNVEFDEGFVLILNRVTGIEMSRYSVVEVVKDGMAWDVTDGDDEVRRLVAQQGCGCGGMKAYVPDEAYSGNIPA